MEFFIDCYCVPAVAALRELERVLTGRIDLVGHREADRTEGAERVTHPRIYCEICNNQRRILTEEGKMLFRCLANHKE